MKKFLFLLASVLLLQSCYIMKLTMNPKNHHTVIITDKWSPIDAHELGQYPIKDTKSFAIGFKELGTDTIKYARDYFGEIYDNFEVGDTIKVVFLFK